MCPICKKVFKSDACPHSVAEVNAVKAQAEILKGLEGQIRKIVREEIARWEDRQKTNPDVDFINDELVNQLRTQRRRSGTFD